MKQQVKLLMVNASLQMVVLYEWVFFGSYPPFVVRISAQIYVEPVTECEGRRAHQTGFLQCNTENLVCDTVVYGPAFVILYGKTTP